MELTLLQKLCSIHSKDFKGTNKTKHCGHLCTVGLRKEPDSTRKKHQRRIEDLYQTGTTAAIKTVQRPEI